MHQVNNTTFAGSTRKVIGGKQVRSLASLSNEKMFKQSFMESAEERNQRIEDDDVKEFHPSISNFKMPQLSDQAIKLSQHVEILRQTRSKNAALIEDRLRTFTMNANMNTTQKKPAPADPELKFRNYVDNTVDCMNRYSIKRLKKKIDHQKELDYKRALAQRSLLMSDQTEDPNLTQTGH